METGEKRLRRRKQIRKTISRSPPTPGWNYRQKLHLKVHQKAKPNQSGKGRMAAILRTISRQWHFIFTESGDNRTRGWFMAGSPIPVLVLLFVYQRFVKKIGPEFMKDRKPFDLDKIIQIYNLLQVSICSWMAYEGFRVTYGWEGSYNWTCQPIDKSMSPNAIWVANITWMYYMLKLFDLFDTVFFVLRKKFNQISFLHVYHHIGVTVLGYIASKYYPDGQGFLLIPLNSFVHAVMYFYYFITNYNPEYKKKIWWKKYITQLQIVQFLILTVHLGKLFFMPKCEYPSLPVLLYLPQNTIITVLFLNFYKNTYLKPNTSSKSS